MTRHRLALLASIGLLGLTAAPARGAVAPIGPRAGDGVAIGSITGLVGNLVSPVPGAGNPVDALTAGTGSLAGVALGVFASGVLGGAGSALQETAHVIGQTTAPRLRSTWFSATYWRVAALAALLSLPFLFAAAAQAVLRADPMLLARSVFGYLPLALIAVSLAAPLTMLLLAATDEMCSVIAGSGMGGGVHFLQQTAQEIAGLTALDGSPFLGIAVGLLTLAAAVALAIEMLVREAAVYVVVLMLPLAFAGLIWPARRTWAVRLAELLVALILSKFVIVAVLSLAGAAYGNSRAPTITRLLTAMTLVMLATFAPWVMVRLLPFTEVAAGAAGGIRGELPRVARIPMEARATADALAGWAETLPHLLRRQAAEPDDDGPSPSGPAGAATRSALGETPRARETHSAEGGALRANTAQPAAGDGGGPVAGAASAGTAGADVAGAGVTGESSLGDAPSAEASQSPRQRRPGMSPEWQVSDFTREIALNDEQLPGLESGDVDAHPDERGQLDEL